ncbi:MAG: MBL fold metallo-hydrolase [Dehalococcoidia bacterium]|nr:MBL fold metallo-hydrolase [Dehalococcoidia bacterium]
MEIFWLGHSCFYIKGKEKTVIADPCPPDCGYLLNFPFADIATISHSHPGHSYIEGVSGTPRQITTPGEYEIGKTFITGIASFHDNERGKIKGKNTIYIMNTEGISLCHLGDLGHPLTSQLIEEIGSVDILFLPVGEISTIPLDTATEIVKQLNPHIILPMHYKTEKRDKLQPVDEFLKRMGIHEAERKTKLSLTQSSLPTTRQTIIMDHSEL